MTLATTRFDFDGGRDVTVWRPERVDSVVLAADGAATATYADALAETGITTTAVVGVHGLANEMARLAEYSPGFDAARFAAHERFVIETVRGWARERHGLDLPAARTAVFGASAGGEFALALGLRHPGVFGAILAGSPGAGFQPPEPLPDDVPRTYLVAGTQEPFFLDNATRWADALRGAGVEVVLAERDFDHGTALWAAEFPAMVRWAFG